VKKNYLLTAAGLTVGMLLIFAFTRKGKSSDFIEIYRSAEFVISASRETSASAWIKFQYPTKKVKNKSGKYIIAGGKQNLQLWKAHCHQREYDVTAMIEYDRHGKVLSSTSYGMYNQPVIPESIGELIYTHICNDDDESYYFYDFDADSTAMVADSVAVEW